MQFDNRKQSIHLQILHLPITFLMKDCIFICDYKMHTHIFEQIF